MNSPQFTPQITNNMENWRGAQKHPNGKRRHRHLSISMMSAWSIWQEFIHLALQLHYLLEDHGFYTNPVQIPSSVILKLKRWEGTPPGQLAYNNWRDIPYHVVSRSAIKAGVKEEEGEGCSEWQHLLSQETVRCDERCFPANGNQWMKPLFCFACTHNFCFIHRTAFVSTSKLSCFYLSDSLPCPSWGEWVRCCVVLISHLGLSYGWGCSNAVAGFQKRWLMPQDCQCSRGSWTIPSITCFWFG